MKENNKSNLKPRDISVKAIDGEDYAYIQSTGIPISTYIRKSIKLQIKADKK